jgi:hypothetical protein
MSRVHTLLGQGLRNLVEAHAKEESTKVGTLRAGNTGALLKDGSILGKCARLTFLRYKGIQVEAPDYSRELMFAAGRTNEDSWVQVLTAADPELKYKTEENIPISWTTEQGIPVTGRPDLVLLDKEGNVPELGIELKLVCSVWTAKDTGINMKPKLMHLLQAAHYSWKLDVPFELWYTSRVDWPIVGWMVRQFPKEGEFGSHILQYNEKGEPKKILPFTQGYSMRWNDAGKLEWRPLVMHSSQLSMADIPWMDTAISKEGIERYYNLVGSMESTGQLPPRPSNVESNGEAGGYSICDYCPLQATCDKTETKGLEKWTAAVLDVSGSLK